MCSCVRVFVCSCVCVCMCVCVSVCMCVVCACDGKSLTLASCLDHCSLHDSILVFFSSHMFVMNVISGMPWLLSCSLASWLVYRLAGGLDGWRGEGGRDWSQVLKASDMWSVGVIIFIMVTGTPPFNGTDDRNIMKAVARGYRRGVLFCRLCLPLLCCAGSVSSTLSRQRLRHKQYLCLEKRW